MQDLLIDYSLVCLLTLFMGFLTVKLTIWGGVSTMFLAVGYAILPGHTSSTVWETMMPKFIGLWLLYPELVATATAEGFATHGPLGGIIYFLLIAAPAFPYLVGLFLGFIVWPELIFFRILL